MTAVLTWNSLAEGNSAYRPEGRLQTVWNDQKHEPFPNRKSNELGWKLPDSSGAGVCDLPEDPAKWTPPPEGFTATCGLMGSLNPQLNLC
jgi:hypothetical protein